MSGGSLCYVQDVEPEDFIAGNQWDDLEGVVHVLVKYGDLSREARQATASALAKMKEAHDSYQRLVNEIDTLITPLRPVWRQLDYQGSGDVSRDDVCKALEEYNRTHGKRS